MDSMNLLGYEMLHGSNFTHFLVVQYYKIGLFATYACA